MKATFSFHPGEGSKYILSLKTQAGAEARGFFQPPLLSWGARKFPPGVSLSDSALREAGDKLYAALVAEETIEQVLDLALEAARAGRQALHVELGFAPGAEELAQLPWELLCRGRTFLVREGLLTISRHLERVCPPPLPESVLPLRVLLCISRPAGSTPLDYRAEQKALFSGLRHLDEQGAVLVDVLRPPTFKAMMEAVRGGTYHVFHFDGHGRLGAKCSVCQSLSEAGEGTCLRCGGPLNVPQIYLLFEDGYGGEEAVAVGELAPVLGGSEVRLVVLSACQSAGEVSLSAGALLRAGVPLVIGMQLDIPAQAAADFTQHLYLALGRGESVPAAMAEARLPLARRGNLWFIPTLYGQMTRLFSSGEVGAALQEKIKIQRRLEDSLEELLECMAYASSPEEMARLRRLWKEVSGTFASARPLKALCPLFGVPRQPYFLGRAEELRQVGEGLTQRQHVVIWGVAGIGKSALAAEAVRRLSWLFPGGVLWLNCQGRPPFASLLNRVAAFCGQVPGEEEVKASTVRALLARLGDCLLVWDGYEGVMNEEVSLFLAGLPGNCRALLTSRIAPEVPGWRVIELGGLKAEDSARLFSLLAADAGASTVSWDNKEAGAVAAMVEFLEGHPLALTFLAPLTARRRPSRLWAELRRQPLPGLEASLNLSYQALSEELKTLFARLSVLTIPFEESVAEAFGGSAEALGELARRALLRFDGKKYSFYTLLRQYAYERLREREEAKPIHRLAAEYFQGKLAEMVRESTPEEALEECDQWEWAGEWPVFVRKAAALPGKLAHLGYWRETLARLERAWKVASTRPSDLATQVALLRGIGIAAVKLGFWEQAAFSFQKALKLERRMGDLRSQAQTLNELGNVYADKGEWGRAISLYQRASATMENLGDLQSLGQVYNNLGNVYAARGEWKQALKFYQKSLALKEKLDDRPGLAQTYGNLGIVYHHQGELERAIEFFQKSLDIKEEVGDWLGLAQTYNNLGNAYAEKGELNLALSFYRNALTMMEELGDVQGLAQIYGNLGNVHRRRGEGERAKEFYCQALEIFRQLDDPLNTANVLGNLGYLAEQEGETDQAGRYFAHAFALFARLGAKAKMEQISLALAGLFGSEEKARRYLESGERK